MSVAERARFWSIRDRDLFFTDWSTDRLRNAEPIPLVPLVFHDCYTAHLSGGGYYSEGKYDWYADRHPRLYELMYAAMPSHNWLPGGSRPIQSDDWGTDKMDRRINWLKRWHACYQHVWPCQGRVDRITSSRLGWGQGVRAFASPPWPGILSIFVS